MEYISPSHGLSDKELSDFRFHTELKRRPVLVNGYSPLLETKYITPCATDGCCWTIDLVNKGFSGDFLKPYTYNYQFRIQPTAYSKRQWPNCDLNYEACTGCNRPMRLRDAVRLNHLLGHKEPKKVIKHIDLDGADDFW